ncbi:MAG TPA: MrtC family glutamic-type intramembrane protease [Polyangiaceae bacterium]|jgi:membrane protease YdiL (CAAX protease family)|nr:MrtC family glutamic-type intramembrane protease [Polyangiaceae bacterium]
MNEAPTRQTHTSWHRPVAITVATTLLVALLSRLPDSISATAVGFGFLAATYWLVWRGDDSKRIARYGLSFAGLFDPEPLSFSRILRDAAAATGWALGAAAVFLPPFCFGFVWWWHIRVPFHGARLNAVGNDFLGQLLVIALPEEAFYRGYLQSSLDEVWRPRWRVLGAEVGAGLLVSSALFAAGHLCTEFNAGRLAVFFPALVFGWLRSRTRGVGAGIVFHALCNLFASYLGQSYGFAR